MKRFFTLKFFNLFLIILLFPASLIAQSYQVNGTVSDKNKAPLLGVSVIIKNTNKGTITDFDGKYSLTVNTKDILIEVVEDLIGQEEHNNLV